MKVKSVFGALLLGMVLCMQSWADVSPEATLDALHKAGAAANLTEFTALLDEDVVFLGMGAQRLEGPAVRDYVSKNFGGGNAWAYRSSEREIRLSADGAVAWFDEALESDKLGRGRATGVLVRSNMGWKVAQYNLTVPITSGATSANPVAGEAPAVAKKRCWIISHKTNTRADC